MKNLFSVIPADFFKPLNSKYKEQYADCLLKIYDSYHSEISFGVAKEQIIDTLEEYYSSFSTEITLDDDEIQSENTDNSPRSNAFKTVNYLRRCGWLDFEEEKNYQQNVVLSELAIPFIKTMSDVIKNEETEYQGLISQIHAVLQNEELYSKPYQFILKNVSSNTEQLVSSLKKLNVSIKNHIDKQTKHKDLSTVLEMFTKYNDEIVSKSLYRLKTSENVGKFRQSIKINLDKMLSDVKILNALIDGFMEIEQEEDREIAQDKIVSMIVDVKNAFENLDKIIFDIDRKNNLYLRNAASRAKFELSSGTNQQGKINAILRYLTEVSESDFDSIWGDKFKDFDEKSEIVEIKDSSIFNVFCQKFVSEESVKKIPEKKTYDEVQSVENTIASSIEEKELKKKLLLDRQLARFYRKKIEEFVLQKLDGKSTFKASEIEINNRKDFEKLIYIRLFASTSKIYNIKKSGNRVKTAKCEFNDFEICRK